MVHISEEIKQWADSHETSDEIAAAIFRFANNDERREQLWQDPTPDDYNAIVSVASELGRKNEKDVLYWGKDYEIKLAKIAIVSGDKNNSNGTAELYTERDTTMAIKMRLIKERQGGDRWAKAVVYEGENDYGKFGRDFETGEPCPWPSNL